MNEEEIVKQLKSGNYTNYDKIVDLYKNRVFGMAYKFTGDYDESQDLAQEVFLKIYRQIKNFREESKLSTWIYRISVNTCLDWKKKKERMKSINFSNMVNEENKDQIIDIKDESLSPDKIVLQDEDQKQVHKLIYELSDKYKTVLIMYHFNEMSYQDIARALDIPERTVETRLYRARRMLKDKMSKEIIKEVNLDGMSGSN